MYFVVNNNRPLTFDSENAKEYMKTIEWTSRLKVTHLVSNTNMCYETTVDDILRGDKEVVKLAEETNLPYAYTVCRRDLVEDVEGKVQGKLLPIDIYMNPPWI